MQAPAVPLPPGTIVPSPGSSFLSRIEGPCCRIYDREDLPWPCCSLAWHGKAPSWNRQGRRFVPDMAATRFASYAVTRAGLAGMGDPITWQEVVTLPGRLSPALAAWWYSRRVPCGTWPELPPGPTADPAPAAPADARPLLERVREAAARRRSIDARLSPLAAHR